MYPPRKQQKKIVHNDSHPLRGCYSDNTQTSAVDAAKTPAQTGRRIPHIPLFDQSCVLPVEQIAQAPDMRSNQMPSNTALFMRPVAQQRSAPESCSHRGRTRQGRVRRQKWSILEHGRGGTGAYWSTAGAALEHTGARPGRHGSTLEHGQGGSGAH